MNEAHIINLFEQHSMKSLGESELALIAAHTAGCDACRQAHEAAQLAALLLSERAAVVTAPSPLFEARVLAALSTAPATQD